MAENQANQSCFIPGISVSFQIRFFYYANWFSPLTMLLSIWCCVSNVIVIIGLLRSGIRSLRPGLLMVCSLAFSDFLWGATVAPINASFRIKNLMNSDVCEVSWQTFEMVQTNLAIPFTMCFLGTIGNLTVMSIDRYLAVRSWLRYTMLVTRRSAVVSCSLVWVTSVTIGCLNQFKTLRHTVFDFIMSSVIFLLALVIIIFQIIKLCLFRRHNNAVAQIMEDGDNQANSVSDQNAAAERELTKTTTYVVSLLGLVFIPMISFITVSVIVQKQVARFLDPFIIPLFTINSAVNPILYYRGNKKVREAITSLIKCK
ncbi:unnamed protein product [Porites evermanni]|uniref:G-protein coupled receptors family 1 profile domain-containing protein n=1 Tax=Porites evermanni TaxID=104178 RepID=A0ABN8LWL0_9CNID|nr:unnamed protein product [Porites evermanni]